MEFTAIARRTTTNTGYEFDKEFIENFNNAAAYCVENPEYYLKHEFSTSAEREAWLGKAKAYGETLEQPLEVRRVKHTDSSNPEHGVLYFVIEPKHQAIARRQRRREATADRERRRKEGQPIVRGKRLNNHPHQ